MILLLIAGVILLILGYMLPAPPPVPVILRIFGWIALAVGILLLVVALLNGTLTLGGAHVG
jgi:hypothetical protein